MYARRLLERAGDGRQRVLPFNVISSDITGPVSAARKRVSLTCGSETERMLGILQSCSRLEVWLHLWGDAKGVRLNVARIILSVYLRKPLELLELYRWNQRTQFFVLQDCANDASRESYLQFVLVQVLFGISQLGFLEFNVA